MSTAIEFENISKQYRLGLVSTKTLSHDLNRWWVTSVLHKEDPYLKIGSINDRASKADSEYVWALKGIDFKVEQGDVVGIIGKNGAGKSTLLKLLSRVTNPTTGCIRARGRIASLLEVGTGFHGELTGRENIFMNGAIMGMTKPEIRRKLDEIVAFAGVERYIDTPVKRYSSGMTVRLGFAVAAHLDPEILVVDEVLAVGDAEFQKKAIGKMKDVSKGEGRTVLFVSHNMASIKSLCKHGVLLQNGMVKEIGDVDPIVSHYLRGNGEVENHQVWEKPEYHNGAFELLEIGVKLADGTYSDVMRMDQPIDVIIRYRLKEDCSHFWLNMHLKNEEGAYVFSFAAESEDVDHNHKKGEYQQICHIPANTLNWGNYFINLMAFNKDNTNPLECYISDVVSFTLANKIIEIGGWMGKEPGDVTPTFKFTEDKLL